MKKMQRNVLNITVTKQHLKQVWFYIICGTTQLGTNYHKSSDCFEYPQKSYFNQATKKILAKISLSKEILKSKISNPQKSFGHPCHLKSGVPPWA